VSFGPTAQTNSAFGTLEGNNAATSAAAPGLVSSGTQNVNQGANFFKTLLSGNQADTAAALQPSINQTNAANQQTLQGVSTLMPRGGGRSGTLFALPFQGNQQIQSLFNNARTQAATALPQIGSTQLNAGSNLFNIANSGAGTLGNLGQNQQQLTNALWSNLGNGLFNLLTTPTKALTGGVLGQIPGVS
jgi:hypothetical protein